MFRYKVKIKFKENYNIPPLKYDCRHIEFNNIEIQLYKSDFNTIVHYNLNDIESIEVKPYVYYIRQQRT